ncbi:MAG TPA: septal ring lytic transglycosylase RlpA family protein [Rhodanobacteraceae bacterium]
MVATPATPAPGHAPGAPHAHRRSARALVTLAVCLALAACSPANVAYRYRVDGRTYSVLKNASHYDRTGVASWYGPAYQGRPTASGQIYNMYQMTAASKVLPFYSYVRVTNLENGRSEVVLINDRGPFYPGRIVDLSYAAALGIGMERQGTTRVRVQVLPGYQPSAPAAPAPVVVAAAAPSPTPAPSPVPAMPAPSPVAPAPATAPVRGQFLQAGLFTVPGDAQRLLGELIGQGVEHVQLQPAVYGGQPATIVIVGPLTTAADVQHAQAVLARMGIRSIPRSP